VAENLRDYRRRIKSVRNTVQLTKAMKMVAAAKLRRSQEAMMAARPYSAALGRVLLDVSRRAHPELHPLLAARAQQKVDLIVCTGDRGLAGAFNTNILKAAEQWRAERERAGIRVEVTAVGRKAGDYFRRRPSIPTRRTLTDIFRGLTFDAAREIAEDFQQRFVDGETDGVFIAYNEFRSVISQKVTVLPILPLAELAGAAPEG
jgi:F-type H+-transporting ATPase subunit gamma